MKTNLISMTIDELKDKQVIKEIYSNIKNYKRAIKVYEERIKEQENLLTNTIINKLNETIPASVIGDIVYFCDNELTFIYKGDGWAEYPYKKKSENKIYCEGLLQ